MKMNISVGVNLIAMDCKQKGLLNIHILRKCSEHINITLDDFFNYFYEVTLYYAGGKKMA